MTEYFIPNFEHKNTEYLKLNTPIHCIPQNPGRPWRMYLASIPQATILVTNRWNRSCFSWIFSKFLTFTLPTFFLTQMCSFPSPMLGHAYQHWERGKSHKCFKICDEYCSSVMIRNLALYALQPKVIRNLRWYRPWILDFSSRLICNCTAEPPCHCATTCRKQQATEKNRF